MGKKKFIDKKKAVTFQLLARDTSDPNYTDEPGSDRVFVRVDNNPYSINSFFEDDNRGEFSGSGQYNDDPNSIFADAPVDNDDGDEDHRVSGNSVQFHGGFGGAGSGMPSLPEHIRKEILELGFPDDGYNYLIHLREIKNTGGGSVFYHNPKARLDQVARDVKAYDASRVQIPQVKADPNEKSIYSVASRTVPMRVQKAVDPEVAALLDDSDLSRFGSDVEDLEEDFVVQANFPEIDAEDLNIEKKLNLVEQLQESSEGIKKSPNFSHHNNAVDIGGLDKVRNQPLRLGDDCDSEKPRDRRLLDEQFDLLELQEYGTDSDDEYHGYTAEEEGSLADKLNYVLYDRAMDDFGLDGKYEVPADLLRKNERPKSQKLVDSAANVIRHCAEYAEKYGNGNEDEMVIVKDSSDESGEWDCETIVSTYSNLDNHPGKIGAPEIARKKNLAQTVSEAISSKSHVICLRGKEKLPVDFLPHRKTSSVKAKDVVGLKSEQLKKKKQHGPESKEEKKERKAAVKEERREARRIKKEMKGLYRSEAQHAQKVAAITGPSSIRLM